MLTYTYISKGKFGFVEKPKPTIQHERDAIVKVTLASIYSSDLHIKHGSVPLITHAYPLAKIDEAYELFERKRDGVIRVAVEC